MATVLTTTQTDVVAPPSLPPVARDMSTGSSSGYLYVLARTGTDTLTLYRSTDSGGSWASYAAMTHTGLQEWSSLVVDRNGWAHIAYRIGTGTADTLWYRRCSLTSAAWGTALQVSGTDANSGSIGSRWQGVDLAVVRHANGTYAICVVGAHTQGTTRYGVWAHGVSINESGTVYLNNPIIGNNRSWLTSGTAPGRSGVVCEVEHNGDGFHSSTPHLWVTWGRTSLRMVKLSWQGTYVGWSGPTNHQMLRSGITATDTAAGRWDGSRWMMPVISWNDPTAVLIYQRNRANTVSTGYETPQHPAGNIRQLAVGYDTSSGDIRVYAVGTSSTVLYYVDYVRGTGTWGAWGTVTATAVLGATGSEWGIRRGGSAGNAKLDVVTVHSGSPNTVAHLGQTASSTPNTPTWDTTSVPYYNGGAADVAASLTLDWTFSDPDPNQGQGSYALSRQIGAGALSYWRASDSTWQATEQQNASATTSLTLSSGWALASDANYTFRVKVWDSSNVPSAAYSAQLVIVPSAKVNPTMTAPTAAQVLNTDQVTAAWTVAEQTARRVRLSTNPGGQVVLDTGFVSTAETTYTAPNRLANGTGWTVEVTTRNNEGLASTPQTRNFTVVYAAPPAPTSTVVPVPASGWMQVTPSSLTPVGTQPAIVSMDLYRRPNITPVLNTNPGMAGNVTGWQQSGGGAAGTLTYSTAQFAPGSSPGAARYVPPAASGAATQHVESTGYTDIVAGALYHGSAWVRPDTASKPIFVQLNWYTSGNTLISSVQYAVSTPVAGAWHFLEVVGDPSVVATAAKVRVSAGASSTPLAADAFYVDLVSLRVHNTNLGDRVAAGSTPTGVVLDRGAASGVDYEYRWEASGANGTTVYGPWL